MLTNKEIDFLFDLEIKIQHQTYLLTNEIKPTSKDLMTAEDFETYYSIMEKIQKERNKNRIRSNDYKKIPENRKRANIMQNINNAKRRNDQKKVDYWTKKLKEYKEEANKLWNYFMN